MPWLPGHSDLAWTVDTDLRVQGPVVVGDPGPEMSSELTCAGQQIWTDT